MRLFSRLLLMFVLISAPVLLGCSPQLSEESTPMVSSDEDDSTTSANDPENP